MILDTNAVSALLEGRSNVRSVAESAESLELPVIVIGEYHYGLLGSSARTRLEPLFTQLTGTVRVLNVEAETARIYGDIRDELRRIGRPIPVNDLWIASLATQYALPILSLDAHFDMVSGLTRIGWS